MATLKLAFAFNGKTSQYMSLQVLDRNKQRVSLEAKNVPQDHIVTCNSTPLVHQDMTKKTTFFMKKIRRDNSK